MNIDELKDKFSEHKQNYQVFYKETPIGKTEHVGGYLVVLLEDFDERLSFLQEVYRKGEKITPKIHQ